jgi:hypothetical protein
MKKIYSSPETAEEELLKNVLGKNGIHAVEMNGQLSPTIPTVPFEAELWVEEVDYDDANAFVAEWQTPHSSGRPWVCPRCGRALEGQFGKCWKCGTRRGAA